MKRVSGALHAVLAVVAAAWMSTAMGANDVGLINQLAGEVSYGSGSTTSKVRPFMRVREGDRFTLPAGAQLRIVYFKGGRQETFVGPAGFTAGAEQSAVQSGTAPRVSQLPVGVSQKIAQTPELIQIARLGRSGGVAVRGTGAGQRLTPQQQAEVRQARDLYQKMRADAAADDITPELYLYSVLQDHLLYVDMKPVVDEMARRRPGDPDVTAMVDYVKAKIGD